MAGFSPPEKPNIVGYGVVKGDGVLHLTLTGAGLLTVGGSLSLRTARELARTILEFAGEDTSWPAGHGKPSSATGSPATARDTAMAEPADPAALLAEMRVRYADAALTRNTVEWFGAIGASLTDDFPRALAALEAVLKAHRPNTADGRCNWCRDPDGQRSAFPCGEYLAIRAALTGEEAGDER